MKALWFFFILMISAPTFAEVKWQIRERENSELECYRVSPPYFFGKKVQVEMIECDEHDAPLIPYREYDVSMSKMSGDFNCFERVNELNEIRIRAVHMSLCNQNRQEKTDHLFD